MSAFDRSSTDADVDRRLRAWMDTQTVTADMSGLYDEVVLGTRTTNQRPRLLVARANGASVQPTDRAWPDGRLTVIVVMALALAVALGLGAIIGSRYLFQATTLPVPQGVFVPTSDVPESVGWLIRPAISVLQDGRVLMAGGGQETGSALVYDAIRQTWGPPIPMRVIRQAATATTLRDGKVLIAGGNDGQTGEVWATAELFDPATDTLEPTGSMAVPRDFHTATLLDDGRVLVVGGHDFPDATTTDAEMWDPTTGVFSPVSPLAVGRAGHTATRLSDGRVAIVGGYSMSPGGAATIVAEAEVFDPTTRTFRAGGRLLTPRAQHGATLLRDGRILIVGGDTRQLDGSYTTGAVASAELFDATSGTFTATGSLTTERGNPSVTLLADGRVLVAGGDNGFGSPLSAEVFDPGRGVFDAAGMASSVHGMGVAPLLAGGRVFLPGGGQAPDGGSELFVPGTTPSAPFATDEPTAVPAEGLFSPIGTATLRAEHTATLLDDGRVLIAGGTFGEDVLATAEIFDPTTGLSTPTGSMTSPRAGHVATLLPDGRVLLAGGWDGIGAEIYDPSVGTFRPASGRVLAALKGHQPLPVNGIARGKLAVANGDDSRSIAILDLLTGELGPSVQACYFRGGAVALPDGTILEGCGADGGGMLYDPVAGTSSPVVLGAACAPDGAMCEFWTPHLLADGRVLAMTRQGGRDDAVRHSATLVYEPATRTFTNIEPEGTTSPMSGAVAQLEDGRILLAGGSVGNRSDAARLLDTTTWEYRDAGHMLAPRADATATILHDGRVLIVGGANRSPDRTAPVPPGAELFDPSRLR